MYRLQKEKPHVFKQKPRGWIHSRAITLVELAHHFEVILICLHHKSAWCHVSKVKIQWLKLQFEEECNFWVQGRISYILYGKFSHALKHIKYLEFSSFVSSTNCLFLSSKVDE